MIQRIGVIYQDRISFGFLRGICGRLGCEAKLVEQPAAIGRTRLMLRLTAKSAWRYFKERGVDLVIRFTDADRNRWQDVHREELKRSPVDARSTWVCGVAVECPEDWMCIVPAYLAESLGIPESELADSKNRIDRIKKAIGANRKGDEDTSDVAARIVRKAPHDVFRQWLKDDALRKFYQDCRNAAAKADCDTPNELETA